MHGGSRPHNEELPLEYMEHSLKYLNYEGQLGQLQRPASVPSVDVWTTYSSLTISHIFILIKSSLFNQNPK